MDDGENVCSYGVIPFFESIEGQSLCGTGFQLFFLTVSLQQYNLIVAELLDPFIRELIKRFYCKYKNCIQLILDRTLPCFYCYVVPCYFYNLLSCWQLLPDRK